MVARSAALHAKNKTAIPAFVFAKGKNSPLFIFCYLLSFLWEQ